MERFDLIVIGGGPGGSRCAQLAAQAGLSTLLLERNAVGGVCLHEGCLPTKVLLHSAKLYRQARQGAAFGVTADGVRYDHAAVLQRKDKLVRRSASALRASLAQTGVRIVPAEGRITGHGPEGFAVNGQYTAKRLCLATGSAPVLPALDGLAQGLADGFVLGTRQALTLPNPPKTLAVIGAGAAGLELAWYYAAIGTAVTVLEQRERIADGLDPGVAQGLLAAYRAAGLRFYLPATVYALEEGAVRFCHNGQLQTLACEKVLLAAGRRPVFDGLGLAQLGADRPVVDDRMRTAVPGIWAVGDCTGRGMLAHTAYRQAEVAVNDMLGRPDKMDYRAVPRVIYTEPEAACVGQPAAEGLLEEVVPMRYSARYAAQTDRGDGFVKVVSSPGGELLGVHLLGGCAAELSLSAAIALQNRLPPEQLRRVLFPHPTVGEALREALFRLP